MAEKQLKTIKFPGLPDTYVIPEGGNIDIDLENSGIGTTTPINADTLGGFAANEYIRKNEIGNSGFENLIQINYSIVGSLTEPANPTQNMIWVETDTPIGKTFFDNNTPSETFVNGDIWICTDNSSSVSFNALKIGDVYMNAIYPICAKQYVSGAWVDVTAKSYQNGAWVDWVTYLYNKGNEYTDLTGGFTSVKATTQDGYTKGTMTKNSESIKLSCSAAQVVGAVTSKKIPIKGKNTVEINVLSITGGGTASLRVSNDNVLYENNVATQDISEPGIVSLAVETLDGEYYVGVRSVAGTGKTQTVEFDMLGMK